MKYSLFCDENLQGLFAILKKKHWTMFKYNNHFDLSIEKILPFSEKGLLLVFIKQPQKLVIVTKAELIILLISYLW